MVQITRWKASVLLQTAAFLLIPCCITCMQDQATAVKPQDRDLKNSATTFIYNMVPDNPQAVISSGYGDAVNTFSVNLLDELYKTDYLRDKNVVVSPYCISRNLAIITEATVGTSKQELLATLGGRSVLDDATSALSRLMYADNSIILQIADALWVDSAKYALLPAFRETANLKYGVEAAGLNFGNVQASVDAMNRWIAANTKNHITAFVDKTYITPLTALILTSTICFEADWTSPFDVTETHRQPFTTPTGVVDVDMMTSHYGHQTRKTDEYENVKLYYGSNGKDFFYLDVYMPTAISVDEFIGEKCRTALDVPNSAGYGSLSMPKFFFEKETDLKPVLKNMGVNRVFDPDGGDITGMVSCKNGQDCVPLFIERIIQKAGIRTDEEGTVAYAVTVTSMGATSGMDDSPDVVLDHPFVYFIRAGETGLILFAGVVNNPNERS